MVIGARCVGVVRSLGALTYEGQTCLVMELYREGSLADRLEAKGKLPLKLSISLITQAPPSPLVLWRYILLVPSCPCMLPDEMPPSGDFILPEKPSTG